MTGSGLRGRRLATGILLATVALDALLLVLLAAAPETIGPLVDGSPTLLVWVVPAAGIALQVAGLSWMIRIIRTDPEKTTSAWRALRDR